VRAGSGSIVCFDAARACVTVRVRYEPIAQNGFVNLPTQVKIDEGYYGKGFYFTRFPRFDGVCARCTRADASCVLEQVQRLLQLRVLTGDA
jgi:hypothetical protein